jgi:hypothetical protein
MSKLALCATLLLAACGGSRAAGPAWPTLHAAEADGGESLAPRQASTVAAIEDAEDATPSPAALAAPAAPPAPAPAVKPDKPASPETSPKEEVLTTEEIIIEIED